KQHDANLLACVLSTRKAWMRVHQERPASAGQTRSLLRESAKDQIDDGQTGFGYQAAGVPRFAVSRAESVTCLETAGLQPSLEPSHALCGRAVSESFRRHAPASHPLDPIVADRGSGIQSFLNIPLLENLTLSGRVSPNACVTVG